VQALLRAAGQPRRALARRNYAVVQLLLQAGLRVSEAAALRLGDLEIHERQGRVHIRGGKGNKERYVPLNATARRALHTYLDAREATGTQDPVFLSETGTALCVRSIQSLITELARRAHLSRIAASIAAVGREEMFGRIASRLDESARQALERVLEAQPGQSRSLLFRFWEYPPEATSASLVDYLDRYRELSSLGVAGFDLSGTPPAVIEHLAQLTRRYDVQAVKRFAPETRTAMLVCFLVEAHKSLLDHLITLHEQYVTGLLRRSRHAFDERHREFRKRARRGIHTVLSAMEILLERRTGDPLMALYCEIDQSTLRAALEDCREFERLEDHGLQDELRARYSGLRRYLPAFLELPFQAERGSERLLAAIELARELNREHARNLPPDIFYEWRSDPYINTLMFQQGDFVGCLTQG